MRRGEAARVADVDDDEAAAGDDGHDADARRGAPPCARAARRRRRAPARSARRARPGRRRWPAADTFHGGSAACTARATGARGDEIAEAQPGQREHLGERAQDRDALGRRRRRHVVAQRLIGLVDDDERRRARSRRATAPPASDCPGARRTSRSQARRRRRRRQTSAPEARAACAYSPNAGATQPTRATGAAEGARQRPDELDRAGADDDLVGATSCARGDRFAQRQRRRMRIARHVGGAPGRHHRRRRRQRRDARREVDDAGRRVAAVHRGRQRRRARGAAQACARIHQVARGGDGGHERAGDVER